MEQKKEEMQPQTRAYTVEEIPGSPLTSGWINWNCNAEERAMAKPWYVPLRYN